MLNNIKSEKDWEKDTYTSVSQYNDWFQNVAPRVYESNFNVITNRVKELVLKSNKFRTIDANLIKENPADIEILRMCTSPPLARDRLTGLSGLSSKASSFVDKLEKGKIQKKNADENIEAILKTISAMLDKNLFPWVYESREPYDSELDSASEIVADRLIASVSNTLIKNAQEQRQLHKVSQYLEGKNYVRFTGNDFEQMPVGTYSIILNVPGKKTNGDSVNIPIDVVIKSFKQDEKDIPLLMECKSAGDFTNTNKRRKEEAEKYSNLVRAYGEDINFLLFLCGYFGKTYLKYEASEGIDWVWEHRITDLDKIL
ncbi:XamI family restriction endonuclease [Bacillus thuringiensis]|uniref:XamI family restriction endonuclease n=1 Tax=Bacillus thuringiensis TaxID=1428 RepID=UPI0013EAD66E|nr:XamI family restriction endonuclease [Bacillus thuringiensis]